jgi:hypothetical protein
MRIITIILIFITFLRAETYPSLYSKLATPLFQAENIFSQYIDYSDIKEHNEIYALETKRLITKGFLLDKETKHKKEDVLLYLKSLRELEKKYNHILLLLSKHLLNSIEKDDYDSFSKLASIPLDSFYRSSSFKQKVITYYKHSKKSKIATLEHLIKNEKIALANIPYKNNSNNNSNVVNSGIQNTLYDVYWTSSINSNNEATQYRGYVYAAYKNALSEGKKILDLGIFLGEVCSDKYGNIYWIKNRENKIYKSDANGENIEILETNVVNLRYMFIDAKNDRIYWSGWEKENGELSGKVGYTTLDGINHRTIIQHRLKGSGSLAIDYVHNKLYIADPSGNGIYMSSLDGLGLRLIAYSPQASGIALDVANNKIIWTDSSTDKIYSANLDGKDKQTLIDFNDKFASPSHVKIDFEKRRLIYSVAIEHQGVLESSDMNGNDRRIEFSADILYNVGGLFIR